MSKISKYLQEHMSGEVVTSDSIREHFSRDNGILKQLPDIIIFVANANDIRKTARFCWQLGEQGHKLPLTVRGAGQSETGASVNTGIILSMQTHYNEVFEFDAKQRLVRLQPGVLVKDLQKILKTYGFRLAVRDTSGTVGGVVASNPSEASQWVQQLEIILGNGEVLQTGEISKRELNRKKGLATLEGEIYRAVDGAINDSEDVIANFSDHDNIAMALSRVRTKRGFDLTPLFLGSQGTLGVISEMIVRVTPLEQASTIMAIGFDNAKDLEVVLPEIQRYHPSNLSFVDGGTLENAVNVHGFDFENLLGEIGTIPKMLLFVRFGDSSKRRDDKSAKRLQKSLSRQGITSVLSLDEQEQDRWRHLMNAAVSSGAFGDKPTLPLLSDIRIPLGQLAAFYDGYAHTAHDELVELLLSGYVEDDYAYIRALPRLDLSRLSDRQKIFKLIDDFHRLVASLGGKIGAVHGEGRLYAPYVNAARSIEERDLMNAIKSVCDPHGILNPGAVYNEDLRKIAPLLNTGYSLRLASDVLPA